MHEPHLTPSDEVAAMAAKERRKWLTVADGQRVREAWTQYREGMDKAVEQYDLDPENDREAMLFTIIAALGSDGFGRTVADSAMKLRELMPEPS